MVRLFTAGGIIVDTVVAADGTLGPQTMGGNAVYSAAGARLWLDGVGIVGRIPANYPRRFLDRLAACGIDISAVRHETAEVREGEWFLYRADGSRADHLHSPMDRPLPAEPGRRLSPDEVARLESRLKSRSSEGATFAAFRRRHPVRLADVPQSWLQAGGAHLAANLVAEQMDMAHALSGRGIAVTLDPGSNALLLRECVADVMKAVAAFLPSEKELRDLAPCAAPTEALRALRKAGPALLLAKLGAQGSLLLEGEGDTVALPSARVVALDPTGAGDAFCGGVLAGLVLTGDPLLAACMGTVSASFAVEAFGPFHIAGTARSAARHRLSAFLDSLDPSLSQRLRAPLSLMDPS